MGEKKNLSRDPDRDLTPGHAGRLTIGRKITLTLTTFRVQCCIDKNILNVIYIPYGRPWNLEVTGETFVHDQWVYGFRSSSRIINNRDNVSETGRVSIFR
jgi:hypothetical protein